MRLRTALWALLLDFARVFSLIVLAVHGAACLGVAFANPEWTSTQVLFHVFTWGAYTP